MGNKIKLMQLKNKQFIMTIPKAIADAMRLKKADTIEFIFDKGDVIIRKI
jgi:AbrB family looped-hinge helix DNA binding protein